jgi:hypothetical protein
MAFADPQFQEAGRHFCALAWLEREYAAVALV